MGRRALILAVLAGGLAGPVWAERVEVAVQNASGLTIMEARASAAGQGAWGGDVLGSGVIADGASGVAVFDADPASCSTDLMVVFDDGRSAVASVDPCIAPSVTVGAP